MTFNLQYGKVLSIAFCGRFLISNYFFPRYGKTQTKSFFDTIQIFGCLINTLSKHIFMQQSTKFLRYPLLRKICCYFFQNFKRQSSIRNANHKTKIEKDGKKIIFARHG